METANETKKPNKIVLILGNGFDLDLGFKTSYKDFWLSKYCPKDYPAPLIKHLNERWTNDIDAVKWYDLENELLEYYSKKVRDAIDCYDILSEKEQECIKALNPNNLVRGNYPQYEEQICSLEEKGIIKFNDLGFNAYMTIPYLLDLKKSCVERDIQALRLIKRGLCEYIRIAAESLADSDTYALNVLFAITKAYERGDIVKIYNFNYTDLPYHYEYDYKNIIYHVHGTSKDKDIIIGTRDSSELNNSYTFLQKSLDSNFKAPRLISDLLDADEVVIFGHSIGASDHQYFKDFFQQQSSRDASKSVSITIFTKDQQSEMDIKNSIQQITNHELITLSARNDLLIIKTSSKKDAERRFRDFLMRHIQDNRQVAISISQLLKSIQ